VAPAETTCKMLLAAAFAAAASLAARPLTLPPSLCRGARTRAAAGGAVCMGVVGASGYTGVVLLRLASHPRAKVAALTSSDRNTSKGMG
jgi:Semialdehyde dehydrogenase, NAD binding domain